MYIGIKEKFLNYSDKEHVLRIEVNTFLIHNSTAALN